jgi:hypothetical protein
MFLAHLDSAVKIKIGCCAVICLLMTVYGFSETLFLSSTHPLKKKVVTEMKRVNISEVSVHTAVPLMKKVFAGC